MPSTATDRTDGLTTSVAVKAPCKAVSTASLTLSGEQTVGGVACVAGDRVLYALAGGSVSNGIWVVSTGAWARAKDFDGNRDVVQGTLVIVAGSGDTAPLYRVTTAAPITIGTTSIAFELAGVNDATNVSFDIDDATPAGTVAGKLSEFPSPQDYGAIADGATSASDSLDAAVVSALSRADKTLVLWFPRGDYYFDASVLFDGLETVVLIGAGKGVTRITASQGFVPFRTSLTYPIGSVKKFVISGMTVDGGYTRTLGDFPYRDTAGQTYGLPTLANIAADYTEENTLFEARDMEFVDVIGLPLYITGFRSVKIINVDGLRCRDIGIVNCGEVVVHGGSFKFGSDAAVSVSRGCQRLTVNGTIVRDCTTGFLTSGFDFAGTGTVTTAGATWTIGNSITVTLSTGSWLNTNLGQQITISTGGNSVVVRITAVTAAGVATALLMGSAHASLQNASGLDWAVGPTKGPEEVVINGVAVVGCYSQGIYGEDGPNRLDIHGVFTRPGRYADSASEQTCTIAASGTSVTVQDTSLFSVGDKVMLEDRVNYLDYHIAEVQSITNSTVMVLDTAASRAFVNDRIFLLQHQAAGAPVAVVTPSANTDPIETFKFSGTVFDYSGIVFELTDVVNTSVTGSIFKTKHFAATPRPIVQLTEDQRTSQTITIVGNSARDGTSDLLRLYQEGATQRSMTIKANQIGSAANVITATDNNNGGAAVSYTVDADGDVHVRN